MAHKKAGTKRNFLGARFNDAFTQWCASCSCSTLKSVAKRKNLIIKSIKRNKGVSILLGSQRWRRASQQHKRAGRTLTFVHSSTWPPDLSSSWSTSPCSCWRSRPWRPPAWSDESWWEVGGEGEISAAEEAAEWSGARVREQLSSCVSIHSWESGGGGHSSYQEKQSQNENIRKISVETE